MQTCDELKHGVIEWRRGGYRGFCDGHGVTKMNQTGNRIFPGRFYRLGPTLSSAGEITATKTEISSGFPPVKTLPSSCALRENGISSPVSEIIDMVSAIDVMLERR